MMVNSIINIYGICQQRAFKASERVSRAEEKKRDYVALSTNAKDFQAVRNALSTEPDIRVDRVEEIRSRIESGEYDVSAEAIADKIISKYFA